MSREIRRVPANFRWPLKKVWGGYVRPALFQEVDCPDCTRGYSPFAQNLYAQWYGQVAFDPTSTGSTPIASDHPIMRARAERNVNRSPEYYGTGEAAIVKEATRLAALFNGAWSHHLTQDDVDALVARDRLWDFTRVPRDDQQRADVAKKIAEGGNSWLPYDNGYRPTAAEVNEWSLQGLGHDSSNAWIVIAARCLAAGVDECCATCKGDGSLEAYPGQREESEAWERRHPPTGEAWQVWETTSEGSPISPVFVERDDVIAFLMSDQYYGFGTSPTPLTRDQAEAFVKAGESIGSTVGIGNQIINGDAAVHELAGRS